MGSRAPWRVDLQRAEVELSGSHLRKARPAARIGGEVHAACIEGAGAIASVCVVAHNGVLDLDIAAPTRVVRDTTSTNGRVIGNGHEAQVGLIPVPDATTVECDAIARNSAIDDVELTLIVPDAATVSGAISRNSAVGDVYDGIEALGAYTAAVGHSTICDDSAGGDVNGAIGGTDAAAVTTVISRDGTVDNVKGALVLVDAAARVYGAILQDGAIDDFDASIDVEYSTASVIVNTCGSTCASVAYGDRI